VKKIFSSCLVISFAAALAASGMDKPEAKEGGEAPPNGVSHRTVPLRVNAVFATKKGDQKLSSIPYSFTCLALDEPLFGPGNSTSVRLGTEVPIPVTTYNITDKGSSGPATSFQYRSVGTNIECSAQALSDNRFLLAMKFEQSAIGDNVKMPGKDLSVEIPMFKTRVAVVRTVFRDGQTQSALVGTEPNSGETATLDVTVNVVK
jgi:hypothetical protein